MKKSILTGVGTVLLNGCLLSPSVSAMSATRIDNGYTVKWETDQPFLVTEIKPSIGQLAMVYTDLDKSGRRVTNANIVWEKESGVGGELVSELKASNPAWAITAYNRKISGTGLFVSGYEQTFAAPTTDLTENTSGILYYYITVASTPAYSLYGKVDYSMCLNSPLYQEGVTCRLEVDEKGESIYYPYKNGERSEEEIEMEEEKPEEDEPGETEIDPMDEPKNNIEDREDSPAKKAAVVGTAEQKTFSILDDGSGGDFITYVSDRTNFNKADDKRSEMEILPLGGEIEPQSNRTLWYNELMKGIETLIVFACGFILAQTLKTISGLLRGDKMPKGLGAKIGYLFRSGGMPSGHAASFVGATTFIGLTEGFSSMIFALAACMSLIVIYDAINVRYAVGEQGKLLMKIAKKEDLVDRKMRLVEGHTVPQVVVGSLLGIMIAIVFWLIF